MAEHGYCECGCGQKTTIAKTSDTRKAIKKGDHYRFVRGHQLQPPTKYLVEDGYRQCAVCNEIKNVSQFQKDTSFSIGLKLSCKKCIAKHRRENLDAKYAAIDAYKRECGCYFCNRDEPVGLDFHHKNPEIKEKNIAQMVGSGTSLEKIFKEIEKCVVVCAYCHRLLHKGLLSLNDNKSEG